MKGVDRGRTECRFHWIGRPHEFGDCSQVESGQFAGTYDWLAAGRIAPRRLGEAATAFAFHEGPIDADRDTPDRETRDRGQKRVVQAHVASEIMTAGSESWY